MEFQQAAEHSAGAAERDLAPGLSVRGDAIEIAVSALALVDGGTWNAAHDLSVGWRGERIVIHVDGRLAIDVRDEARRGAFMNVRHDASRGPGVVERAEILGPPVVRIR